MSQKAPLAPRNRGKVAVDAARSRAERFVLAIAIAIAIARDLGFGRAR